MKIIEEAEKTNKYMLLEDEDADEGLRTNNWSTRVRKHQKGENPLYGQCMIGFLNGVSLVLWQPGV